MELKWALDEISPIPSRLNWTKLNATFKRKCPHYSLFG